jgi:hypothetical protein
MRLMVLVAGDSVLEGSIEATISTRTPRAGTVYACDRLTVAEVRRALDAGVIGFITVGGNFACHAANLLRSARHRGSPTVWVRSVDVGTEQHVRIYRDGVCEFTGDTARSALDPDDAPGDLFAYAPGETKWQRVCLWPRRPYAADEFDLIRPGLERGASELAGGSVTIERQHGRVWFNRPALTSRALVEFATDPRTSVPYLHRMLREYSQLVDRLRAGESSSEIPVRFFSTLLPFHKSYPQLIGRLVERHPYGAAIADRALTNGVVRWLDATPEFRSTVKIAGDRGWAWRLPPDDPRQYVEETIRELVAGGATLPSSELDWLATLAVVKEFKMILSKNIYAIFLGRVA